MRIVADAGILAVEDCFRDIGDLVLVSGRELRREHLLEADALLVRSITPVNAALLHGTPVRFVGTATSGTDHLDLDYLRSQQIEFVHTKGSNANAVVDYCFAALAWAELSGRKSVASSTIGLVGAGHVGGRFAARLQELGFDYRVCDPPLESQLRTGLESSDVLWSPPLSRFASLDSILQCDIISLHVPLVGEGEFPTRNLLDRTALAKLSEDVLLINTCRGAVVDESALHESLRECPGLTCVVDVWAGEPDIDLDLVSRVGIATPHIAGYSQNAKLTSTILLAQHLSRYFGVDAKSQHGTGTNVDKSTVKIPASESDASHWQLLLELMPLLQIDAECRAHAQQGTLRAQFDSLRSALQSRREFRDYQVDASGLTGQQQNFLTAMGMGLVHARR